MTASNYSNSQNSIISFDYSWFLAKNHSNFVSITWKLDILYCHIVRTAFWFEVVRKVCALTLHLLHNCISLLPISRRHYAHTFFSSSTLKPWWNKKDQKWKRHHFWPASLFIFVPSYSQVSIKRAGYIKRAGWNIFEK